LNNVAVGRYLAANFACAFEQKGDFRVVRVGDRVEKQGGNVVSYFCTSDLRVVHLVVGPVDDQRFLKEATFAVEAYRDALAASRAAKAADNRSAIAISSAAAIAAADGRLQHGSLRPPTNRALSALPGMFASIRESHAAEFANDNSSAPTYVDLLHADPLKGKVDYANGKYAAGALEARWERLIFASRRQVHTLLAYDPLPPLRVIDSTVFRRLAGETVNDQDGSVRQTVVQIEAAAELGQPTALVLYSGTAQDWRRSSERRQLQREDLTRALKPFSVVHLPIEELPALSSLLKGFELPQLKESSWSAQVLLLDCRKKQLDAFAVGSAPATIVATLGRAKEQNGLARAEMLQQQSKAAEARRALYGLRNSKDRAIAAKAKQLLAADQTAAGR
jgi:hypothetical protein